MTLFLDLGICIWLEVLCISIVFGDLRDYMFLCQILELHCIQIDEFETHPPSSTLLQITDDT